MWERVWREAHTVEKWRWVTAEAERRGEALPAVAGLIRSTYQREPATREREPVVAVSEDFGEPIQPAPPP